jgi:hypothetical protein
MEPGAVIVDPISVVTINDGVPHAIMHVQTYFPRPPACGLVIGAPREYVLKRN